MVPTPRKELRVPVVGTITFSFGLATYGGTVKNISIHGCQVESVKPPPPDTLVSYRMYLSEADGPLEVKLAVVLWVQEHEFGLKILEMHADTVKRLRRFLDDSYLQMARARRGRPASTAPDGLQLVPETVTAAAAASEDRSPVPHAAPFASRTEADQEPAICSRELSTFVGWILDARRACRDGGSLPLPPELEFEEFEVCAQFIHTLLDQTSRAQCRDAHPASSPPPPRVPREPTFLPAPQQGPGADPLRTRRVASSRRRKPRAQGEQQGEATERAWAVADSRAKARGPASSLGRYVSEVLVPGLLARLGLRTWRGGPRH